MELPVVSKRNITKEWRKKPRIIWRKLEKASKNI